MLVSSEIVWSSPIIYLRRTLSKNRSVLQAPKDVHMSKEAIKWAVFQEERDTNSTTCLQYTPPGFAHFVPPSKAEKGTMTDHPEPEDGKPAYWQMNTYPIPEKCPIYLQNLSPKNMRILQTRDSDFTPLTWAEVKDHVSHQRLDIFWRRPSEQRRYLEFCWKVKQRTSMPGFVMERLGWISGETCMAGRFENPQNIVIKRNDWPYGIDDEIAHLVVWTKFKLLEDEQTGMLTERGRREVAEYVERQFCVSMPNDDVIWFKNWNSLKSVDVVEHFHVMLYKPEPLLVAKLSSGDAPLSERFGMIPD